MSLTLTRKAPWDLLDFDPDEAILDIQRMFPEIRPWFGEYTGSFLAAVRDRDGRDRLVEAATPGEFVRNLNAILRTWIPVPSPAPVSPILIADQVEAGQAARRQGRHEAPQRPSLWRRLLNWAH